MVDLQNRIIKLIKTLFIPEEEKASLTQRVVQNGVTPEIVVEVKKVIDQSVSDYEEEVEREVKKLQDNLNKTVQEFEREYSAIQADAKNMQKQELKKKEEQDLDQIRKKLSQI
jgi:Fe2+ transport system protein B